VKDLGSRNGTFLNGDPASEALVITAGDQLRCGQLTFEIGFEDGAAET
jgi:pSer/pThr/pTyr-binding forkhead associated (FHA) protein